MMHLFVHRLSVLLIHWTFILLFPVLLPAVPVLTQNDTLDDKTTIEGFPILSYDSDAGVGYGAKAVFIDILGHHESFDLILFNSTNGEQWYRFAAAWPDAESRRGKAFPASCEVIVDYDKWIANRFYGIGPESMVSAKEEYTREPVDVTLMFGHGASPSFVLQGGIRYRSIRNANISAGSRLSTLAPPANRSVARSNSILARLLFDTRDNITAATRGTVISLENEWAVPLTGTNVRFVKAIFSIQGYRNVVGMGVFAGRLMIQSLSGNHLPIQVLVSVGGNNTLRGYPQDRFLDYSSLVGNMECRIPILRRFGGVIGVDAGQVARGLKTLRFRNCSINGVAGVRYKMETFVVRLDVGVSSETTGVYLNFGELF